MRLVSWRSSLYRLPRYQRLRVQNRNFSLAARLAASPRSPNDPPASDKDYHNTAAGEESTTANAANTSENAAEKVNATASRTAAGRRAVRAERSRTGVPPPPPLPDWFLTHNVRRQKIQPPPKRTETARQLRIQRKDNQESALIIPYFEPSNRLDETLEEGATGDDLAEGQSYVPAQKGTTTSSTGAAGGSQGPEDETITPSGQRALSEAATTEESHQSKGGSTHDTERLSREKNIPVNRVLDQGRDDASASSEVHDRLKLREMRLALKQFGKGDSTAIHLPSMGPPMNHSSWARFQAQLLVHSILALPTQQNEEKPTQLARNLIFQSSDPMAHVELDQFVEDTADLIHANIIRMDASDIAELAGDYVDGGSQETGSISSLAYDAYEGIAAASSQPDIEGVSPSGESMGSISDIMDPGSQDLDPYQMSGKDSGNIQESIRSFFDRNKDAITRALGGAKVVGVTVGSQSPFQGLPMGGSQPQPTERQEKDHVPALYKWQELKLEAFLDQLVNSALMQRDSGARAQSSDNFVRSKFQSMRNKFDLQEPGDRLVTERFLGAKRVELLTREELRLNLARYVADTYKASRTTVQIHSLHDSEVSANPTSNSAPAGTIIHVRDLDAIRNTPQGELLLRRLVKVVSKRRKDGEPIIIIGTCASTRPSVFISSEALTDQSDFQVLQYPSTSVLSNSEGVSVLPEDDSRGYGRIRELNLRSIQDMIRRLGIPCGENFFTSHHKEFLYLPGTSKLGDVFMDPEEVERVVLFANGLRELYTGIVEVPDSLQLIHICLAMGLINVIDHSVWNSRQARAPQSLFNSIQVRDREAEKAKNKKGNGRKRPNLDEIRKNATKHEQRLMSGVVDPTNIKTAFKDVHAPVDTIDALKTTTSLALLRPEAFQYGVLANDRLPGLLLYGPPGTGKTMLAKAVAKESGATVLEISGAQIYEKYVGEGEKMVRAVFSLAKKLSPCVVFIDEADAIFGSRGQSGNRTTHREIINQFLREWDGMDDQGVFIMVATNRPFDLDDAVLRRLPRRILVDLPVKKDRESILGIHLQGEALAAEVDLSKLAEQTPFYSGSDLKNVCVSAALAAVKQENALLEQHRRRKEQESTTDADAQGKDDAFQLPEHRTLTNEHFEKAIQEISASINEDMSSLAAIKKFDERFGDRKGRKKKSGYGFGMGTAVDKSAARVRGDEGK